MKVQMKELAQSARGERECGVCGQPLFGLVAYCPYCGRKHGFTRTNLERDDHPQNDKALASGQGTLGMPAGELHSQEAKSPRKEPRGTPLQGVPIFGESLRGERNRPAPSQLNRTALTLLFKTVVAGIGALLLFWMVVKLTATKTNDGASPQLPISTSGIASPSQGPSTSAVQVPPIPLRTDTAVPPQTNRRSLCSVANETAGLCKSQE